MANNNQSTVDVNKTTRLDLGEAFMYCKDCMAKLYSFDGTEDKARSCPNPKECSDQQQNLKSK